MPYYAQSAYYPLPGSRQAAPLPPQPQQQQQYGGQPAQVDQAYLRQQQIQAEQIAYQQQQQQLQQQQQYVDQQNRQLAQQYQQQQQYAQQQQRLQQQQQLLQQQQYAAQQQRLQQQGYSQQQQSGAPSRQLLQQAPLSPAAPQYKSSEYVQIGGGYQTGGAFAQPLRRVPSRADVNTAVENQEAPYQSFGQGLNEQQQRGSQYNPYANYGQAAPQSPLRPQASNQRIPSEYSFEGLQQQYKQQQYAQGSEGGRTLAAPITVVLDANNNAPLPPRSPARGYSAQQKGYGSGAQAESAYIAIPNDLVYAQNNAQRAYTNYGQESRPAYASNSRTNQASSTPQLKPAAARELYAALSSENVRTALERDAPILEQAPAYSTYNGQRVQGRAFVIPAQQKYSEYNVDDLNNLRSVIDR